jgi:KDO2-lipid IV(A) lauroyltransferase
MEEERILWRNYPSYFLLKGVCGCIRLLPEGFVRRASDAASGITYMIDARHRRLALRNLDLAFGDSTTIAEKRRIARGAFRSLFRTVVELISIPRMMKNFSRHAEVRNAEGIARALHKKRGVLFLISHFGNWEIMAHACVALGHKLASVGRPLKNPLIYREIERLRCFNGAVVLKKKWIAREIIERLKNNWCVALLVDQYAGRHAPFVPFFGHPVSTTPAAALLAMKTGAVVLPVFDVRERYGYHHICVCDPVDIVATGDREADIRENCARFNCVIEDWVRRYPDQWLWMHRRWRRKKGPDEP